MSAPYDAAAAAGTAETALPADVLASLPATSPPAPWNARCTVTLWWHAARRDTAELLPPALRTGRIAVVTWVLVRYEDTPVGPYSELAAIPLAGRVPPRVHIPFITVDSLPSVAGGRVNWLLPKALARVDWSPDAARVSPEQPASPSWEVSARWTTSGPPLPYVMPYAVTQAATDGSLHRFSARMAGLARLARVEVDGHADGPLGAALRTGQHRGLVMTHCRFRAGPSRPI